jgi:hypothetical protein
MTMLPPKIKKLPDLHKPQPGYIAKNPSSRPKKQLYTREKVNK